MTVFYHTNGKPSMHPTNRKDAKQLRRARYDAGVICSICLGTSLRFTFNGKCVHCCRIAALDYYNDRLKWKGQLPPLSPEEATFRNEQYYITPDMCSKAGHVGVCLVKGTCVECAKEFEINNSKSSPRQKALETKEKWYVPLEPCSKCNTTALRYVANGRCQGCNPLQRSEEGETVTAETTMIQDYPTLIFTRERAIANGLTVYRTGEPCGKGHTTYRWIATEACISCR